MNIRVNSIRKMFPWLPVFLGVVFCAASLGAFAAMVGNLPDFTVRTFRAGDAPFDIQVGDFDNNGNLDFAVASRDSGRILLFLLAKDRQGHLGVNQRSYETGRAPVSLFTADLDGDGHQDLVTANLGEKSFAVLMNKGKAAKTGFPDLAPLKRYPLSDSPHGVWGADFDRDGDIDLAVAVEKFEGGAIHNQVMIFENTGKGEFKLKSQHRVGTEGRVIVGADLDGDGAIDLITTNKGSRTVSLLFNDGKGSFPLVTSVEAGDSPQGVWAGDLDGDGDVDIAVTNVASNTVTVLVNQGKRLFEKGISLQVQGRLPYALVGIDVDRDGDTDLMTANLVEDNLSLLLNEGRGQFAFAKHYVAGNGPRAIAAGDFDGDGLIDLVIVNRFGKEVALLLQKP